MPKSLQKWSLIVYAVLFAAVVSSAKFVGLAVDYLWFKGVGLTSVFTVSLSAKVELAVAAALIAALVIAVNLFIAGRSRGEEVVVLEGEEVLEIPNIKEFQEFSKGILGLGTVVAAVLIGGWAMAQWETVLRFFHSASFGSSDPVFDRDIGFYVFSLPFYRFLYQFLLACVVVAGLLSFARYFLGGKFLITSQGVRLAPSAGMHLGALAGVVCLLAGWHFYLKMFEVLYAQGPVSAGPGYTILHAQMPLLKVLAVAGVLSAILFWAGSVTRRLWLGLVGVGLIVAGMILNGVYPVIIQKLIVAPNEIIKETPYIVRAIEHTRRAFGIGNIQELEFEPSENLTAQALARNDLTIKNIRLWDHTPLLTTFSQLQEIRTYYEFLEVDNDRYTIDGELRQVMLSPRELLPESLPSRIWINEHLTYTHGYGICLGPVNRITKEGLPEFFIKDIPPESTGKISVTRPEIYYGEAKGNYVIVNTGAKEFDYPSGDENVYTTYQGTGGVLIKGLLRRLLFAVRFGELKILISGYITNSSRILYHRTITERVKKATPFITYDRDPYLVVSEEGRLFWIIDGYTITDRYPYSEQIGSVGNYIRNSVKAVVDAYNGSLSFYLTDENEPIVKTYASIFPGVFKPISEMPRNLREHIRYPEGFFAIQASVYATYHMTDPQVFYNKEDLWKIPVSVVTGKGMMAPYYMVMKLASVGKQEEFIIMLPFTPSKKENMIAWMAARCDEPNYGKLLVYNFPKKQLVYGPKQIESRIDQDAEISKEITLWGQGGSRVTRGSLMVVPVEESLLYVQPLYIEAEGGGLPELKRVIVAYGNTIAMEENLEESLNRIFGRHIKTKYERAVAEAEEPARGIKELIKEAQRHFKKAHGYLGRRDWAGYGDEMREVERFLKQIGDVVD